MTSVNLPNIPSKQKKWDRLVEILEEDAKRVLTNVVRCGDRGYPLSFKRDNNDCTDRSMLYILTRVDLIYMEGPDRFGVCKYFATSDGRMLVKKEESNS